MIGLDKAIQLLLGNYIITGIVFAMGFALEGLLVYLGNHEVTLLWFDATSLSTLVNNGKLTLQVAAYGLGLFFWYQHGTINIQTPHDEVKRKGLLLLIVPLCVLGVLLSLGIILLWNHITDLVRIQKMIPDNSQIQAIIFNIPVWIMLHGMVTFLISLDIKFLKKSYGTEFNEQPYE